MHKLSTVLLLMCSVYPAAAEVAPLEIPLGEMVENIACFADPTQTYTLYVPSTYSRGRRLPVLLVFDPRGRSLLAAELFRDAAESYGWIIVSSDNTRSDGPWDPNVLALQALWPEVRTRIPADFKRIYAAGFSGGAAVALLLAKTTGEVAGIVACGGHLFANQFEDSDVPVFSVAGDTDFNFLEMSRLDEFLSDRSNPNRLATFEGAHTWLPPSVAREAIEWFELLAMREGLRDLDPAAIESLYASDLSKARALAAEGQLVVAARRLREMEATFAGLHDTAEAKELADSIESAQEYKIQLKQVAKARAYEESCNERRTTVISLLRDSEIPPPTRELAGRLLIADLKRAAEKPGEEGLAARRCLSGLHTALSFYYPRDELAQRRYAHVAKSYELAILIRDDNAVVWYNLACVRAQSGRKSAAVEALENALKRGFNRYELLRTDADLDPLRDREDFKKILASVSD